MTTLTVYADLADGQIQSNNANYSTARSGSALAATTNSATYGVGQAPTYYIYEIFESFDTSSVPVGSQISAVTLSLYLSSDTSTTDFTHEARVFDWGASLTTADWIAGADLGNYTLVATRATSGIAAGYNDFSDVAFTSNINAGGSTRIIINSDRHRAGTTPTQVETVSWYAADQAGTTNDPKLVVTYSDAVGKSGTDTGQLSVLEQYSRTLFKYFTASDTGKLQASESANAVVSQISITYSVVIGGIDVTADCERISISQKLATPFDPLMSANPSAYVDLDNASGIYTSLASTSASSAMQSGATMDIFASDGTSSYQLFDGSIESVEISASDTHPRSTVRGVGPLLPLQWKKQTQAIVTTSLNPAGYYLKNLLVTVWGIFSNSNIIINVNSISLPRWDANKDSVVNAIDNGRKAFYANAWIGNGSVITIQDSLYGTSVATLTSFYDLSVTDESWRVNQVTYSYQPLTSVTTNMLINAGGAPYYTGSADLTLEYAVSISGQPMEAYTSCTIWAGLGHTGSGTSHNSWNISVDITQRPVVLNLYDITPNGAPNPVYLDYVDLTIAGYVRTSELSSKSIGSGNYELNLNSDLINSTAANSCGNLYLQYHSNPRKVASFTVRNEAPAILQMFPGNMISLINNSIGLNAQAAIIGTDHDIALDVGQVHTARVTAVWNLSA